MPESGVPLNAATGAAGNGVHGQRGGAAGADRRAAADGDAGFGIHGHRHGEGAARTAVGAGGRHGVGDGHVTAGVVGVGEINNELKIDPPAEPPSDLEIINETQTCTTCTSLHRGFCRLQFCRLQ